MQSPLDRDRRVHQKEPLSPPKGPWVHEAYSLAQPRPFLIAHLSPYASHSKISGKECRFNPCAPIIRLVKKYARPIFAVPRDYFSTEAPVLRRLLTLPLPRLGEKD